jgi:hypothetical protein
MPTVDPYDGKMCDGNGREATVNVPHYLFLTNITSHFYECNSVYYAFVENRIEIYRSTTERMRTT